jgi:hypothetical protein
MKQFEIWKFKPPGFGLAHYFVVLSSQERCSDTKALTINALLITTLHGDPKPVQVVLDQTDGLDHRSVCQCDLIYTIQKSSVWDSAAKGNLTAPHLREIKDRLVSILRLD